MSLAESNGQEKTEQPTSKRRKDARSEGNVFQSRDVVTVVVLFGVFWMVKLMLPMIYKTARDCVSHFFSLVGTDDPLGASPHIFTYMAIAVLKCSMPVLLMSVFLGILAH